jgi:hypothetical protein
MATPRFLLIAWLIYPLIKTVHELAHGLAVRRFGGEVHQVGVSLLLTPAPLSMRRRRRPSATPPSAWRERRRHLTELAIAGLR